MDILKKTYSNSYVLSKLKEKSETLNNLNNPEKLGLIYQ